MRLPRVRRGLHGVHALATLALLATGLLLWSPELRGRAVGGYGRSILEIHLWTGLAFLAAPGLALLLAGRALLADARRRLAPPGLAPWRAFHLALTLAAGALLGASGLVLGFDTGVPLAVWDAARASHLWATWAMAAALPVHLVLAARALVSRYRLRRAGPPPLFELAEEGEAEGAGPP